MHRFPFIFSLLHTQNRRLLASLVIASCHKFATISPDVFRRRRSRPRLFVTTSGFLAFLLSRVSMKVTGKSLETVAAGAVAPRRNRTKSVSDPNAHRIETGGISASRKRIDGYDRSRCSSPRISTEYSI